MTWFWRLTNFSEKKSDENFSNMEVVRPRGRPKKGCHVDPVTGRYVPTPGQQQATYRASVPKAERFTIVHATPPQYQNVINVEQFAVQAEQRELILLSAAWTKMRDLQMPNLGEVPTGADAINIMRNVLLPSGYTGTMEDFLKEGRKRLTERAMREKLAEDKRKKEEAELRAAKYILEQQQKKAAKEAAEREAEAKQRAIEEDERNFYQPFNTIRGMYSSSSDVQFSWIDRKGGFYVYDGSNPYEKQEQLKRDAERKRKIQEREYKWVRRRRRFQGPDDVRNLAEGESEEDDVMVRVRVYP